MKVTKTVRNYVERKVAEKYPETAEEKLSETINKLINEANEIIRNELQKAKEEIIEKVTHDMGFLKERDYIISCGGLTTINTETRNIAYQKKTERKKKIENKVEDILVSLELGATKEDLEKMLNEI